MSYTSSLLRRMAESDRLSREGLPLAALEVLMDEPTADYPIGGSVEPYDMARDAEIMKS